MYSAAAVLVIALSIPIVYQIQNKEAELTSSEVESYLVNHTTLSDDDIVNLLEQEDIDQLKIDTPIEKKPWKKYFPATPTWNNTLQTKTKLYEKL